MRKFVNHKVCVDFDWSHNHTNESNGRSFKIGTVHVQEWNMGAENGGYPPTQNGDIRSLFWLFSLMALQN